jgi:acetyl esterase/lipase
LKDEGFEQLAMLGDSAGGGLALAALSRVQTYSTNVASAVVFSPWVDLALSGLSLSDPNTRDPIFQPAVLQAAASTYLNGAAPRDSRASPLYDIPAKLPPLALQVGSRELLLDDACRYAHAAARVGGEVRLDVFDGLHHVFQRATEALPSARAALDDAASFIAAHWR